VQKFYALQNYELLTNVYSVDYGTFLFLMKTYLYSHRISINVTEQANVLNITTHNVIPIKDDAVAEN